MSERYVKVQGDVSVGIRATLQTALLQSARDLRQEVRKLVEVVGGPECDFKAWAGVFEHLSGEIPRLGRAGASVDGLHNSHGDAEQFAVHTTRVHSMMRSLVDAVQENRRVLDKLIETLERGEEE